jgi:cysteine desulfurase
MDARGFSLDSGSACISANLEPSHVLAAMGRLTHGNVRLRIYPEHTLATIEKMLVALKEVVTELRADK